MAIRLSGQHTIKINGDQIVTKADSVKISDFGFPEAVPVMLSDQSAGYQENPKVSEIECTGVDMAGQSEDAFFLRGATVEIISDTGIIRTFRDCSVTPKGLDKEELTIEIKGQRIPTKA